MDENVELLNYIHQNAEMGRDTLEQLLGISKNEEFKEILRSQLDEYKLIDNMTKEKLAAFDKEPKDIGAVTKARTYIAINVKTLTDKSPSHISEMLIQGSTMGIIDITKKMKEHKDADKEIVDLANKLLAFEQRNVDECKKYLQ
ncbi:MAG TPA: hypothetical protein VIO64_04380 [Pseudobacteroides sp.]|uniref:hypothetical protein n=1 Tax=Pseudobacteroides sp. TaxID=1968840 RepID=UPI002F9538D1